MNTKEVLAGMMGMSVEDLEAREPCTLEFDLRGDYINPIHDTFHWLDERVSYDARMDRFFQRFESRAGNSYWFEDMDQFARQLAGKRGDLEICFTGHHESLLSDEIRYAMFTRDQEEYAIIMIDGPHGWSRPRAFTTGSDWQLYDYARAGVMAEDGGEPGQLLLWGGEAQSRMTRWSMDNGCHWDWQGEGWDSRFSNLETYLLTDDEKCRGSGDHIYVDPDGIGYCPILGAPLNLWYM